MSELSPSIVPLALGLDLQSPKLTAPAGSLLDCLNYEQVDFVGQKRIDGYVRYDGSLGSYQDIFYSVLESSGWDVGDILVRDDNSQPWAVVVDTALDSYTVGVIDFTAIPSGAVELKQLVGVNPEDHYDWILTYNAALRRRTTTLPGPVAGLHWFNDRLYAVSSLPQVNVGSGHGYMPRDTYLGLEIVKVTDTHIYLATADSIGVPSDTASLFQSRSEGQASSELGNAYAYGWSFVHQGWTVPFEQGVSLYGGLIALNQNIDFVAAQGPSPITGRNGSPLALLQKVNITNSRPQVNGWKNYNSPSGYNLNPDYVETSADATYVYADAYISWDKTTGVVTAETEILQEYSPTATVEVEV